MSWQRAQGGFLTNPAARSKKRRDIVVIGASAGGVEAVLKLFSDFAPDVKASFFVTMHVAARSKSCFPELISRRGNLRAEHARDGAEIKPGCIYVAPPDRHLVLSSHTIRLSCGPKENRHRPAIDPLFRSAAESFRARVAGVLLTGNLDDGVAGLRSIQQHGGLTVVQDPAEALFPDMPLNALRAMKPDFCLVLKQIEQLLKSVTGLNGSAVDMKLPEQTRQSQQNSRAPGMSPPNGTPAQISCPECKGPMWESREGEFTRFECLVGHKYSLQSLLEAHSEEVEAAFWVALRTLEERVNLQRRLVEQSQDYGHKQTAKMFQERMIENEKHARMLRAILDKLAR